jgi:hypothetical protein
MPLSLFESAYIRSRAAIGEECWHRMTDLQHADIICCEMYRLAEVARTPVGLSEIAEHSIDPAAPSK